MADQPTLDSDIAKRQLAEDKAISKQAYADYEDRMKGKPTPTQEENDLAAYGAHFTEHEDDGSGPDPFAAKQLEARKPAGGGYQTRQAAPAQHRTQHTQHTAG
jgi:hypothetical protein